MRQALTEQVTDAVLRDRLIETFSQMADHLRNTPDPHGCAAHGLAPSKAAVAA